MRSRVVNESKLDQTSKNEGKTAKLVDIVCCHVIEIPSAGPILLNPRVTMAKVIVVGRETRAGMYLWSIKKPVHELTTSIMAGRNERKIAGRGFLLKCS